MKELANPAANGVARLDAKRRRLLVCLLVGWLGEEREVLELFC